MNYVRPSIPAMICVHLIAVIYGACGSPLMKDIPGFPRIWNVYGTLTGAKNQFGFFAPRVSSPSRIRIKVSFADRAPKVQLFQARTIEGRSRFSGLLQRLRDLKDVDYRRVAAAAVAAYMFDQWPAALSVTVQLESLYIPSLPECRKGINSNWNLVFSATFNQGSKSDNSIRHKENY